MPANILSNNYTVENVFLGKKFFVDKTYTNSTGSTVTLVPGQVMGTVLATGKVLPQVSTSTDGSEFPSCICADNYSVPDGTTITISVAIRGEVNQNKLTLGGTDTLDTPVRTTSTGGGTIYDLILRNTEIILVPTTELSNYDN